MAAVPQDFATRNASLERSQLWDGPVTNKVSRGRRPPRPLARSGAVEAIYRAAGRIVGKMEQRRAVGLTVGQVKTGSGPLSVEAQRGRGKIEPLSPQFAWGSVREVGQPAGSLKKSMASASRQQFDHWGAGARMPWRRLGLRGQGSPNRGGRRRDLTMGGEIEAPVLTSGPEQTPV